jgi:hypothetical protein
VRFVCRKINGSNIRERPWCIEGDGARVEASDRHQNCLLNAYRMALDLDLICATCPPSNVRAAKNTAVALVSAPTQTRRVDASTTLKCFSP